ncbi:LuxR C-terminal-related transcriptional regulator [Mesorhizobium sp. M0239]
MAVDLGFSEVTVNVHRTNMMKKKKARSVSHPFNDCQPLPTYFSAS